MTISVAIVDDHRLVRDGLARACAQTGRIAVVHEGSSVSELFACTPSPDVVLLDLHLRDHDVEGSDVLAIREAGMQVILVSATSSSRLVRELLRAGAAGFVSKVDGVEELIEAIEAVSAGATWTTPELAALIARDPERPKLSTQEALALQLYASGLKLDSVARRMGVASTTVREYIARVRAKYEAVGRPAPTKVALHLNAVQDGYIR